MKNFAMYMAGFVGKNGGDIQMTTVDRDEALTWTKEHIEAGRLAVMRGYTHEEISFGLKYMNSILVTEVLGFDGLYTKGYLYQLAQDAA